MIPEAEFAVRSTAGLSLPAMRILFFLLGRRDGADEKTPHMLIREIADPLKLHERTVRRELLKLEADGWINVERGRGRGNRTRFHVLPSQKGGEEKPGGTARFPGGATPGKPGHPVPKTGPADPDTICQNLFSELAGDAAAQAASGGVAGRHAGVFVEEGSAAIEVADRLRAGVPPIGQLLHEWHPEDFPPRDGG